MSQKIDPEVLRQRLTALPQATVVEALLTLAQLNDQAEALVTRLTATSGELVKLINRRLAGIRRRRKFLFRSQAPELAAELSDLLADIEAAGLPPAKGMALTARFIELDAKVFEICDDSYGAVGAVFHGEVPNVFWHYATAVAVADPDKVVNKIIDLVTDDPWSTRADLLTQAPDFLAEPALAQLAEQLWIRAQVPDQTEDERVHWAWLVMHLARVQVDPDRYRAAALLAVRESRFKPDRMTDGLSLPNALESASLCLARGRAAEALALAEKVSAAGGDFHRHDCELLLQQAHAALGHHEEECAIARRRFAAAPSAVALTELVVVIGESERDAVVDETLARYTEAERLDLTGLRFMLELGRPDLAAAQIEAHCGDLDGEQYYVLPAMAEELIGAGEVLAASLILRALIAANLAKANTKYYGHGVRYLVLARRLAGGVADWRGQPDHATYFAALQEQHKRKVSFWKRYLARKR